MRPILAFLLLVLTACGACGARQIPDEVPTLSDPTVGLLTIVVNGEKEQICTVWKVDETKLMTAGHCCAPNYTYLISGPHAIPGTVYTEVLRDDDENDVCVIKGEMIGAPLVIANRDPMVGERVWTLGYPQGVFLISDGHWSGRSPFNVGVVSTAGWRGASGSPILNSKNQVVGLLEGFKPPQSNLNFTVPIEWIKIDLTLAR